MTLGLTALGVLVFAFFAYRPGGFYWRLEATNARLLRELGEQRLRHRAEIKQLYTDAGLEPPAG